MGAGLSRTSPIRRSAKGLGREGEPTIGLVKGAHGGGVVSPRVYIAGGGDTTRAEIGGICLSAGVFTSRTEGRSSPLPRETAEVEVFMARDGLLTSRGRETTDVSFRRSRWSLE
jgi:hypothetical protein